MKTHKTTHDPETQYILDWFRQKARFFNAIADFVEGSFAVGTEHPKPAYRSPGECLALIGRTSLSARMGHMLKDEGGPMRIGSLAKELMASTMEIKVALARQPQTFTVSKGGWIKLAGSPQRKRR